MKIIHLVFMLGSGGGAKFVVNLSNQLAEMGHDVTIMQIRNDERGEEIFFNLPFVSKKVKYLNLGLTKGFKFGKALKVMQAIKKLKPDIVHSHLNVLPYYYPISLLPGKPKFVHTLHNLADKECGNKIQQKINRFFFKIGAITPVTISKENSDSFEALYHLPTPYSIDNGCPTIQKTDLYDSVRTELSKFKINPDTKIFLHVARFHEAKNQKMLISAFNKLIADGKNISLVILGTGFDEGKGLELKQKANERIHFLGTKTNVGDYMVASDYFVLSSEWEGLPISLIEAMSVGLVPIVTPAGGIKDVVKNGVNGFISSDFSEDRFMDTIKQALSEPLDKSQIIKSYSDNYSMLECARKYVNVYES